MADAASDSGEPMRRRLLVLTLLLVAVLLAAHWLRTLAANPLAETNEFLVIAWGQPNTSRHVGELAKFYRNVEVDMMLDRNGVLVGAHDPAQLDLVQDDSSPDPLTLPQLLSLPFERVFLDMKDTLPEAASPDGPSDGERLKHAERAVAIAFDAAAASGRLADVYVMAYRVSDEMVALARERGAQLMLEGYPKNDAESLEIVRTAARYGIRQVCLPLARLTDPVLEASRRDGVAHIPYTFFQEDWSRSAYQRVFEEHLVGLILPPGSGHRRFLDLLSEDRATR